MALAGAGDLLGCLTALTQATRPAAAEAHPARPGARPPRAAVALCERIEVFARKARPLPAPPPPLHLCAQHRTGGDRLLNIIIL